MTLFYLMIMMIIQIIGKILCLNWNLINKVKIKFKADFFNAYSVEPLTELLKIKKNKLTYRHAMLLFLCIGDQLNYLEKDKYSILTFDIKRYCNC